MQHELPALGVAAVVNDELEALPEWVAFHLAVGVSHFLIADSGSTDGTLGYLRELEALGLVTLIQVPARAQEETPVAAYAELLARCPAGLDLLAFLEADDFLLPLEAEAGDALALRRWLGQRFADPDVSALALHRACFGSAGERFRGDGLVVERFIRRASRTFFANRRYRSVVRPARVRQFLNPHHAELTAGSYHDSQGQPLEVDPERPGVQRPVRWEGARINHYAVKSVEEFVGGKNRGRAYFERHDRNTRECTLAREWAPWVQEQLLGLPAAEPYAGRVGLPDRDWRVRLAARLPAALGRRLAPPRASLALAGEAASEACCELLAPLPRRLVYARRGPLLHARLTLRRRRRPDATLRVSLDETLALLLPLSWQRVGDEPSDEGGAPAWQATLRSELPLAAGCFPLSLEEGDQRLPLGSLRLSGERSRRGAGLAHEGVLVGREQWLFLDQDTNLSLYQHLGRLRLTATGLERWRAYARELGTLALRLGVRPLMVVAPGKERVMARYHPLQARGEAPVEQALSVLPEDLWLYPLEALQALGDQACQVNDTHWTQRAAGRVLGLALARLGVADEAAWEAWFAEDHYREVSSRGDLGGKLVPPRRAPVARLQGVDHREWVAYDNGLPNMGRIIVWENPDAHRPESCLVLGASSSYLMFAFLARIFRRVVFVHSAGNIDPALVERVAPDLLLLQTNARFMVRPPVVDWALDEVIADKLTTPLGELERQRERRRVASREALSRWGLLKWHDVLPEEWFKSE